MELEMNGRNNVQELLRQLSMELKKSEDDHPIKGHEKYKLGYILFVTWLFMSNDKIDLLYNFLKNNIIIKGITPEPEDFYKSKKFYKTNESAPTVH